MDFHRLEPHNHSLDARARQFRLFDQGRPLHGERSLLRTQGLILGTQLFHGADKLTHPALQCGKVKTFILFFTHKVPRYTIFSYLEYRATAYEGQQHSNYTVDRGEFSV